MKIIKDTGPLSSSIHINLNAQREVKLGLEAYVAMFAIEGPLENQVSTKVCEKVLHTFLKIKKLEL